MSTSEVRVKAEALEELDVPENFFDDFTSTNFLDELVNTVVPIPKKEELSEGEVSNDSNGPTRQRAEFERSQQDFSEGTNAHTMHEAQKPSIVILPKPITIKSEPSESQRRIEDNVANFGGTFPSVKRENASPPLIPFKRIKLEKQPSEPVNYVDKVFRFCSDVVQKLKEELTNKYSTRFFYTPTMIMQDSNYENDTRSPLVRIKNVEYQFNSTNSKIDTKKLGITKFSKNTTNIVKLLGLDINEIANKVLRNEANLQNSDKSVTKSNSVTQYYTPFYNEASTQTEKISCNECIIRKLKIYRDQDIEVKPTQCGTSTQTIEEDELPIMATISSLNTSQLLALNDFSEIIKGTAPTNATEAYRLREKLMDVFNLSQRPPLIAEKTLPLNVSPATTTMMATPQSNMMAQQIQQFEMMVQQQSNRQQSMPNMVPAPSYLYAQNQSMMPTHTGYMPQGQQQMMQNHPPNMPMQQPMQHPMYQQNISVPFPPDTQNLQSHNSPINVRISEDPRIRQRHSTPTDGNLTAYQMHRLKKQQQEKINAKEFDIANRSNLDTEQISGSKISTITTSNRYGRGGKSFMQDF